MRLPNGFGSVVKLKDGKRRKPWRARITVGFELNEETGKAKQKMVTLGYFKTKQEAVEALAEFHKDPYDVTKGVLTFKELFEQWWKDNENKFADSYKRSTKASFNYCKPIWNEKINSLGVLKLLNCVKNASRIETVKGKDVVKEASLGSKEKMKSFMNNLLDYAVLCEMIPHNYARDFSVSDALDGNEEVVKFHKEPFTNKEIDMLWERSSQELVRIILVGIYSGWRPSELMGLEIADVDWEQKTMKGGMKTESGKDRLVPIHPKIEGLLRQSIAEARELGSEYVFNLPGRNGIHGTYDVYQNRFKSLMEEFGKKTSPHSTRHTFITLAKAAKVDEYVLKLIVGHHISDITERVYTHRKIEELHKEIRKIQ